MIQEFGRVQKSVAMQSAKSRKLGFLQSRNRSKDAQLLAVFQLGLKSHHVEQRAEFIVLPQLDDGVSFFRRIMRVREPERLHRSMPERFAAAFRHHLDWQAAIEIR